MKGQAEMPEISTSVLPLVLPVARLSLRQPCNRRRDALLARGLGLGLCNPLDVLALVAGTQRLLQIGWSLRRWSWRCSFWPRDLHSIVVEGCRLSHQANQLLRSREIIERRNPAELAHRRTVRRHLQQ